MKKLSLCLLFLALASPAFAYTPEAFPGAIWSSESAEFDGIEGLGSMGWISQGVQWITLPENIHFQTYGAYKWRFREDNDQYFDAHGPAVGAMFTWQSVNWGAEYNWWTYPSLYTTQNNASVYINWYERFYLIGGGHGSGASLFGLPVLGFPTTTWGQVTDDFNFVEGLGTMGFVNQGIEWFKFADGVVFRTVAAFKWRYRAKNQSTYNLNGPSVAAEIGSHYIDLGAEYGWWRYPGINLQQNEFRIYASIYVDWDLKKSK